MTKFQNKRIALGKLELHEANVRGHQGYDDEGINRLAGLIKSLGQLQPLLVQAITDGRFGVLAGGRRLNALQQLEKAGDLPDDKIDCRVVPKDLPVETAVSLAENITQEPMNPIDAYDAFTAMVDQGLSVDAIARDFGLEVRQVQERLRYGRVHPAIRAAARGGDITLDALKAFGTHPCQDTQHRVFQGLVEAGSVQSWAVRTRLKEAGLQEGDALGQFVSEAYRSKGGEVKQALFPEETVLVDRSLAEEIAADQLHTLAAEIAAQHGFGWAEGRVTMDYSAFGQYRRIYPQYGELSEEDQARLAEITRRKEALETDWAEADAAAAEHLDAEITALDREIDAIERSRERYDPERAKGAGVIVSLGHNGPEIHAGLIRPEDQTVGHGDGDGEAKKPKATQLSQALRDDLSVERADAVAAALLDQPRLAQDALLFAIAVQTLTQGGYVAGIEVQCRPAARNHGRPDAREICDLEAVSQRQGELDLTWLDDGLSEGDRFAAFRALDPEMKGRIAAWCLGALLSPGLAAEGEDSFVQAVAAMALPNIRERWTPRADNLWDRVRKPYMLHVLGELGMSEDADALRTAKKATLAKHMETLFARPFATLTDEQRAAVSAWTPAGMATVEPAADDEEPVEPRAAA